MIAGRSSSLRTRHLTNPDHSRATIAPGMHWGGVPLFLFHFYNDVVTLDRKGAELADAAAAYAHGIMEARTMASDQLQHGHLNLDHRIEIQDEDGKLIAIPFRSAFIREGLTSSFG